MLKSSRLHSILVRVLLVVLGAGLVSLTLATVVAALVVTNDKEASLTSEAVAEASRMTDALDRRVERAESDLAAVALAAEAGRPFQAQELIGADLRAVRVEQDGEVIFEGAEDRGLRSRLAHAGATLDEDPRYLSGTEILVRRDVGALRASAILDATAVLAAAPQGWRVELHPRGPDERAGVLARRATADDAEWVHVTATGEDGPSLELSGSLEPARRTARGVVSQVVLWSWLAIVPLVLFAMIFTRRVTAPVRALALAVDQAGGENPIVLPPLPNDEIGELGLAIGAMSQRVRSDASALHRAVRFARHAGVARDRDEILEALLAVLEETAPLTRWHVLSADVLALGTVDTALIGVPLAVINARLDQPLRDSVPPPPPPPSTRLRARARVATVEMPRPDAIGDDTLLIPLRTEEDRFGVVIGHGASPASIRMAQLVCRVATASMRNLQLSQQALAGEKMAALGRLAASVAHEINSPLSSVLSNLHALERGLDGERLEIARDARQSAQRVSAIVRDLSLLARGGRTVSLEPGDLMQIAASAVAAAQQRAPGARIDVVGPTELWVSCSVARLEQALTNIIGNAVDAAAGHAAPGVEVTIGTHSGRARILIRDNGTGVPPSVRQRLFEPFVTGKGDEGTGLGLYLARTFARIHGGDVELVESGREGATFELWVPSREVAKPVAESISTPAPRPRPRLLVIDDDRSVLRATQRWLGQHADVTVTSEPEEALSFAARALPHLVLCDRSMPSMGGEEMLRALHTAVPALEGRVVFFSGDVDTSGASVAVFPKPLRERDVERILALAVTNMQGDSGSEARDAV